MPKNGRGGGSLRKDVMFHHNSVKIYDSFGLEGI